MQRFDALGRRLRVDSADTGARLTVADAAGKPLRQWDSREQTMSWRYDALQRPTHVDVAAGTSTTLVQRTVYGEAVDLDPEDPPPPLPRSQEWNLRGQVYQVYDCAGLMTSEEFDFKGKLLRTTRRVAKDYIEDPEWIDAAQPAAHGSSCACVPLLWWICTSCASVMCFFGGSVGVIEVAR